MLRVLGNSPREKPLHQDGYPSEHAYVFLHVDDMGTIIPISQMNSLRLRQAK